MSFCFCWWVCVKTIARLSQTIWEMNGTSVIGNAALSNPGSSWHLIGTGDFNGDGKSDLLWQSTDGTPAIWEMHGTSVIGGATLSNPGSVWHLIHGL